MGISYWQSETDNEASTDWVESLSTSPSFVFDEKRLAENLALLSRIRLASGCHMLYSIKACPFKGLLEQIRNHVDGFSVSSLFEARLAHEVTGGMGAMHITTPGFRQDELAEIGDLCDAVSFNSLSQLERLPFHLAGRAKIGLRINPQRSFLDDPRYDPCRAHSKLGAPLSEVVKHWREGTLPASGISGLHLHTNFCSSSFAPLQSTVAHLQEQLPELVRQIEWINLGGGYQFQVAQDLEILLSTIAHIQSEWQAEVYMEPGTSVVDDAGVLVSTVIDTFESEGKSIAVLDTSVNHLPEVFEYQVKPKLRGEKSEGAYSVILAGCTCLSGDLFGEYQFDRPLRINDRLIFENVGAYSLIKASRFNGLNLPSIHFLDDNNQLRLMKTYDYADYHQQWSGMDVVQQTSKTSAG
ncbi:MAG: hypothetical protein ABW104_15080 [Candidatus Thiodiazotropha sp. 6PLUC2]